MYDISTENVSRRSFLKTGAATGAGLTLGVWLPALAQQAAPRAAADAKPAIDVAAFVRIGTDNTVTVISKHLEMGQGTYTGLATLVAEELDAAWSQVRVEGAPANPVTYRNLAWEKYLGVTMQGTGQSTAIANSWRQMRSVGAAARAMLVAAAAKRWNVSAESITVKAGVLTHASGKRATFGELAQAAAALPAPAEVKLKDPKDFVYIGRQAPRVDSRAKSNGAAIFTQDVKLSNMLVAVVAHPPRFGAKVKSFDASGVQGIAGVRTVLEIPTGVAVLATAFWPAKMGRDALKIEWDETTAYRGSTAELFADYRKLAEQPGTLARNEGDAAKALAGAARVVEATYQFPYLAHAAMEPMNCVIRLGEDICEVWNGDQFHSGDQLALSNALDLGPEKIRINTLFAGGSFGRRASSQSDYLLEAAQIVRALALAGRRNVPVKLVWTREDDTKAGYYRPAFVHTLKAGLDGNGNVIAWQHRLVGQSINAGTILESKLVRNGVDEVSVEGAVTLPYAIPNLAVELHSPKLAVPVLWWR